MQRALVGLVLLAFLAGCNSPDDPVEPTAPTGPPPPPPPPPPPSAGSVALAVNDTWTYLGSQNETTVVRIVNVTNATVRVHSLSTWPDNGTHEVNSTITADTLALVAMFDSALGFEVRFSPPLPILIPAEDHVYVGNISVPTPFGEVAQPATATIRFLGLENVSVPAGDFETYRYNATVVSSGFREFRQDNEIWFAPKAKQAVRNIVDGELRELVSHRIS